jgi:hypothetical protein
LFEMSVLHLRSVPNPPHTAASGVSRELARLDPFSFFVISGEQFGVERVVVGSTGTFVLHTTQRTITGPLRHELAVARKAAKRVRNRAAESAVHTTVHAVLCLQGRQFAPFVRRGVKVIPWASIVREVAGRNRVASQHQMQRVAERLGAPTLRAVASI